MKNKILTLIAVLTWFNSSAQVSILTGTYNSFNITPESLLQLTVANQGKLCTGVITSQLTDANNNILMKVVSNRFTLNTGTNILNSFNVNVQQVEYGSSGIVGFIKASHTLPSGKFNICSQIETDCSTETKNTDQYCDNIESEHTTFLTLVTPSDKEEIQVSNPFLIWNHSDHFALNQQGEYYRMIVVQLNDDQDAGNGIATNIPIYYKDFLETHQIQYPFDAPSLIPGKRYGWQVQKITNGIITNTTEAWEFKMAKPEIKKILPDNKYAELKLNLDGSFYAANNNKIFFIYNETYKGGKLKSVIYDEHQKTYYPEIKVDEEEETTNRKKTGTNFYKIDLNELKLANGFYTLQIINSKKEKFLLKIKVEQ